MDGFNGHTSPLWLQPLGLGILNFTGIPAIMPKISASEVLEPSAVKDKHSIWLNTIETRHILAFFLYKAIL